MFHNDFVVNVMNIYAKNKDSDYNKVDKSNINIVGNPYKTYLDPVYYNSKISMNARRLQMMSMLSELVPKRKIASIMDSYDFNLRNIDVNKQLKKRY